MKNSVWNNYDFSEDCHINKHTKTQISEEEIKGIIASSWNGCFSFFDETIDIKHLLSLVLKDPLVSFRIREWFKSGNTPKAAIDYRMPKEIGTGYRVNGGIITSFRTKTVTICLKRGKNKPEICTAYPSSYNIAPFRFCN